MSHSALNRHTADLKNLAVTVIQWTWYGACMTGLCGCLPFILPFDYQDVNEPPVINFSAPENERPLGVTSLGLEMFVAVTDRNDLEKLDFFWWVESENSSLNTPLDNAMLIPNSSNTELVTKISLTHDFLLPYSGGSIGLRVRDSFGTEAVIRWQFDVQETSP